MKVLLFSDCHWNTTSSLIRKRGNVYSVRLEHLINSMNWVNQVAVENNCNFMICAGDFMDKAQLTDEELTAIREIKWNDLTCYFLCGNHESSVNDLHFSSIKAIESENHIVLSNTWRLNTIDADFIFLPYVVESDRKELSYYLEDFKALNQEKPRIIISHNDLLGVQYGGIESRSGFSIDEIEQNCSLYLNGHIHNSAWISNKVLNLGSFSGHNFTNNSSEYKYGIWILDTDTLKLQFIENPYGFNFYKFEIMDIKDISKLDTIKDNAVLSIRCSLNMAQQVRDKLVTLADKIIDQRLTIVRLPSELTEEVSIAELRSDHLLKFSEFCHDNIENSSILEAELAEVCK